MRIFITGTAGFIGFHLARRCLPTVTRSPALTPSRPITTRLSSAAGMKCSRPKRASPPMNSDSRRASALAALVDSAVPDIVVHLAAQAGVRYSAENPAELHRVEYRRHVQSLGSAAQTSVPSPAACLHQFSLWRKRAASISKKASLPTAPCRSMPRPRSRPSRSRTAIRTMPICQRRWCGFSRCTVRGGGPTWRSSSSPATSLPGSRLRFSATAE